ncbi:insulinase family protein [Sphingomonas psychrotolerans]|uniref:Insulinase family protein n=1 Tax=Sphingomonas psychrotolerans TaxID=1327635 RepID=A0ABU3NBR9_9SPHN|nr:pitrilysin family protein [Sphingomonas psychrotolerans]MDT8760880.1 insulinase family protein [Sphingomonas psychrotolerans]
MRARTARRLAATLLLASATTPAAAQTPPKITVPPIAFTERTLPNGLRVIAIRDTTTPSVSVQVWYDVGSKHDPDGRSGFAHLFEHILSRKTRNMPYNMINRLTENVGGVRNASTWFDRTNYYETVPAQYLETMLWTHAERMARPVIDAEVFNTERNVVKEEFRQRILAPAYGRLRLALDDNSHDTVPARRSGIGSLEQLDAATLEDALAFHEAYYGPDTATLIVAGNFDPARLDTLVDRYFAAIPRRKSALPLAIRATEKPRTAPRTVTMYAPNVPLPLIASSWRIPGSAHPDIAPLVVLDAILANGDNSRLKRALVFDRPIASSAATNFNDVEDNGFLAPVVTLASGATVEQAETALAAEIARLRDAPVSPAELAEAKNEMMTEALAERETASGRAFTLGEALVRTGDSKAADKRLAAISRVTAADVQRVARLYLKPEARVDFRYLDESKRPADAPDNWRNPAPMPHWATVPPATRTPLTLAPEGEREQPPAPSAAVPVTNPVIAQSRLANGMALVSARTGSVPIATLSLVFKGGSATDPQGQAGVAELAALVATKGTAKRSARQIAAELEALGASITADATPDGTILSVTAPVAALDAAGDVLADVARNATFPADEFEQERRRTVDRLQVAMKNPGSLASMTMQRAIYGAAPYGGVGTPRSLGAIERAALVAQRDRWWRPDNATLIVTGGIAPDAARRIGDRLFADWRGTGAAPEAPAPAAGKAGTPRVIVVDMPGAGQAAVAAGLRIPSRRDPAYPDLMVANAVLGAGSNGRLFQEVRVKRALSYGAYSSLAARADEGMLSATAQTKNESAPDVAAIFAGELARLANEPLDAESVAQRVAFLQGGVSRQSETSAGFANALAGLVLQGVDPVEAAKLRDRIGAVTTEAAAAAARRTIAADRATIVIVGDGKLFLTRLRERYPQLEVIPIAALDLDRPELRAQ